MAFNTFVFLFLFFPFAVLLFYLPGKEKTRLNLRRKIILFVLSLLFYAWGEPKAVLLLFLSLSINYFILRAESEAEGLKAKLLFAASLLLNILLLAWGKYLAPVLPLGLSFYTFRLLSAAFDLRKHKKKGENLRFSYPDFAVYVSFFPQLTAGPIARFDHFLPQLREMKAELWQLSAGLRRFLPALFVKVLLADGIFDLWQRLAGPEAIALPGFAEALTASLLYSFYIYLDFSSYSKMASGLSLIFGFRSPKNFNKPYRSASVSDFWRRWHISLSSWFRDYVYIPLGGNRKGAFRQGLNILIVWLLTGIWHGSSLNFVIWGLYYAIWLLLEKFYLGKHLYPKLALPFRRLITFLIVNLGWVFFAFPKKAELSAFLAALTGQNGLSSGTALYLISSHSLLIILALLFAFDLPEAFFRDIGRKLRRRPVLYKLLYFTGMAVILLLSVSFIIDRSFSSFLYFNF